MPPGKIKYVVIGLGVVIIALLGILAFVPAAYGPTAPANSSSTAPLPPEPAPTSTNPAPSPQSGVRGSVTLGPTCPVERIPPDPACAPKPYVTRIFIYPVNSSTAIAVVVTDSSANFMALLPVGDYLLVPQGGYPYALPRCSSVSVHVSSKSFTDINLSCDTGIR